MKKVFIGFILSFIFCSPVFAEEYNFVNYYDVEDTLRNELMVGVSTSSSYLIAVGTYQHATSSISVANSKKYSFSASGLGDVFYFSNSTLSNKYDNTAGLNARLDF